MNFNKQEIEKLYFEEFLSIPKIAVKYNVSTDIMYRFFKRVDIKRRSRSHCQQKYKVKEHIFENINTEEKAYWLGLLYADGSNIIDGHEIKISLQERDKELVEGFKNFMGYTGPLRYINYKEKYPTWSNQWSCIITNEKISQDLNKLGMTQNKTYTLRYPTFLEKNLQPHFIRGFFDGDGCIFTNISKTGVINGYFSIVCHPQFLDTLQNVFIEEIGLDKTKYSNVKNKNENIKVLKYGGNHQLVMIREFLYKDATIFLQRKKDKFDEIKTYRKRKQQYL